MGGHAFSGSPKQFGTFHDCGADARLPILGSDQRWNVPTLYNRAALGARANSPGADRFVLTLHLGGVPIRRVEGGRFRRTSVRGAISLQVPGSGGHFRS